MPNRTLARPLRRRTLFAIAGATGAGAVLSACGAEEEEPSVERDAELLTAAFAAELAVERAYSNAGRQELGGEASDAVATFADRTDARLRELRGWLPDRGLDVAADSPPEREHALDAAGGALEAAIAAYHAAIGRLSTVDQRRSALELAAECAAQLAAIQGLLGEEQAPQAFVTGGEEPPHEAEETS